MEFLRRYRAIIIIAVIVIALAIIGVFVSKDQTTTDAPTEKTQAELVGTVIIDNTDRLSEILLPEQYSATEDAVSDYIHKHIKSTIDHATITQEPVVANDGSVSFSVTTDNPTKTFRVVLDRKSFDQLILRVPETNYQQTIATYDDTQTTE